jgi:hypothetical protein
MSPDAQMIKNVVAIGEWLSDHEGIPTGGEIHAYEVSAKGIEVRILHRFSNYEDTRRDGAAIVGRIERGDFDADMVRNSLVGVDDAQRLVEKKTA